MTLHIRGLLLDARPGDTIDRAVDEAIQFAKNSPDTRVILTFNGRLLETRNYGGSLRTQTEMMQDYWRQNL